VFESRADGTSTNAADDGLIDDFKTW
jgi:hypothetical protein